MPRVKVVFTDDISSKLTKIGEKNPEILNKILLKTSSEMKLTVDASIKSKFTERTGKMRESLIYHAFGRARYRLKMPNLAAIYELNGAEIYPKNAPLLKWIGKDGNWYSSNMVVIEPKPFFYGPLRRFEAQNRASLIAESILKKEYGLIGMKLI